MKWPTLYVSVRFSCNYLNELVQITGLIWRVKVKGFHTGMILIGLQKAFDTSGHTVLLQKMDCIGFEESNIKWFQLYL